MSQKNYVSVTNGSTVVRRVSGPVFIEDPAWQGFSTQINNRGVQISYLILSSNQDQLELAVPYVGETSASTEAITQVGTFYQQNLTKFLPAVLVDTDPNGTLANLCEIVALSMDELSGLISDLPNLYDIDTVSDAYLPYLANLIGYPLASIDTLASQRFQLKNAFAFYKKKGLLDSFKILFYALGYQINIVELWTSDYQTFLPAPAGLDPNLPVPEDSNLLIENGGCWFKTPHFGIEVSTLAGTVSDANLLAYLKNRVELVRPVHTVLDYLHLTNSFSDQLNKFADPPFLDETDPNAPFSIQFQYPASVGDYPRLHSLYEYRHGTFP